MAEEVPKTMKAAILKEWGKPTEFGELPTPTLKDGQVLIQVKAAPINPSDLSFMNKVYPVPAQLPIAAGFEGSGVVVKVHSEVQRGLQGKRVAFSGAVGSYAQYIAVDAVKVLPIPDDVSFEAAASSFVNPLTVILMLRTTKKAGVKAVVHTAAASALGKQMVRHFQANGVEVINVIRRQEQADSLKKIGAKHILNQTDSDFDAQLKELSQKLDARIAFDAIAGDMSATLMKQLPNNSSVYVYGALSQKPPTQVDIGALIFQGKNLAGYWQVSELAKLNEQEKITAVSQIPALINSDLASEISKEFTHSQFNEAVSYYTKNMSAGKVLIKPE